MEKRIISVFVCFCIAIGVICLRLYTICTSANEYASTTTRSVTFTPCKVRGSITDCHSEKLTDTNYSNYVVLKPTASALKSIENISDSDTINNIRNRMSKGSAVSLNIGKSEIKQNKDAVSLRIFDRYTSPFLAQHIIGYIDENNNGINGIEAACNSFLHTDKSIKIRLASDAKGRIINGSAIKIENYNSKTNSVMLTIDKTIQEITENVLDSSNISNGCAIVLDASTGAVRAMASRPNYNPYRIADYLNSNDSPLMNKCLQPYSVGSVFKVAVCTAAIENGQEDFTYNCTGSYNVGKTVFRCNKSKAHGKLNMEKALQCSCNCYFINLAEKIGKEKLLETANLFGFGQKTSLYGELSAKSGSLPEPDSLKSAGNLANFSFGQGDFTSNIFQIGQMMCAVANGGKYCTPYIVEKITDSNSKVIYKHKNEYPVFAMSEKTSAKLTKMLVSVVEKGNASKAKLNGNTLAAGKTATAQTGRFDKNGVEICNTWFGGFFPADKPRYVIVIMKQGGSSGATDCAPVFKKIADFIQKKP